MKNEPIRGSGSKEMDSLLAVRIKINVNISHLNVGYAVRLKLQLYYPRDFFTSGKCKHCTVQLEQISNTLSSGELKKNLTIYFKAKWQLS